MKKRTVIALVALIVCACAFLTGCQSSKAPRVEYVILGLELKNNTGKAITECYIYDAGSDEAYGNIVDFIDGADGMWLSGKDSPSQKGFIIRPAADIYKVKVVYLDGTQMVVSGLDLLLPNEEGLLPNEIALIDDAMGVRAKFDEDPGVQLAIDDAIFMGVTMDGWYPPKK